MLRLVSNNTIGTVILPFNFVTEVEINSTWETLTDTCRITLPKKLNIRTVASQQSDVITNGTIPLWKRLDPVTIKLGYEQTINGVNQQILNTVYVGKIARIYPQRPLIFECEDQMLDLKLKSIVNYSKQGVSTLDVILSEIFVAAGFGPGPNYIPLNVEKIQVVNFTAFSATKTVTVTIAEVLDYFKRLFNVAIYFQANSAGVYVLNVGFPYKLGRDQAPNPKAIFNNNDNIITWNLDFMRSDDVLIQIEAINFTKGNVKQVITGPKSVPKVTIGDALNSELRTIYTFDQTPDQVKKIAKQYLYRFKYTGFRGSFTTFLQPTIRYGDAIQLIDTMIPDGNGTYLVKKVVTKFGTEGGRQEIFLDQQLVNANGVATNTTFAS